MGENKGGRETREEMQDDEEEARCDQLETQEARGQASSSPRQPPRHQSPLVMQQQQQGLGFGGGGGGAGAAEVERSPRLAMQQQQQQKQPILEPPSQPLEKQQGFGFDGAGDGAGAALVMPTSPRGMAEAAAEEAEAEAEAETEEEARARERAMEQIAHGDALKACIRDLKTPFASVEDAISRLLPYQSPVKNKSSEQEWDDSQEAEAIRMAEELEKQVMGFNVTVRKLADSRAEERLMVENLLLADEQRMSERVSAVVRQREVAPQLQQVDQKMAAEKQKHILQLQGMARHQQEMLEHQWPPQELMELKQRWHEWELEATVGYLHLLKAEQRMRAALQAYVDGEGGSGGGRAGQQEEEEEEAALRQQRMLEQQQQDAALQQQRAALQKQLMLELQQAATPQRQHAPEQQAELQKQVMLELQQAEMAHPRCVRCGCAPGFGTSDPRVEEQQHRQGFVVPRAVGSSGQAHRAPARQIVLQPQAPQCWAPAQAVPLLQQPQPAGQVYWAPAPAVPQPQAQAPQQPQPPGQAFWVQAPQQARQVYWAPAQAVLQPQQQQASSTRRRGKQRVARPPSRE